MNYSKNPELHEKVFWGNYLESDLNEAVSLSRKTLFALNNAEILITGASGFVGAWIAAVLIHARETLDLNYGITLSIRNPEKFLKVIKLETISNIKIIKGNLQETSEQIILKNLKFSHVIHAATPTTSDFSKELSDEILDGTRKLIDSVSRKNLPNFVHLSSGAVYGLDARKDLYFNEIETSPDLSGWEYARCKIQIEDIVKQKTIEGAVLGGNPRLFTFMGPHLSIDNTFAIGEFVRKSINKERIFVSGNPKSSRSYMYPTDMVSWILAILIKPTLNPTHIGSESACEMGKLAENVNYIFDGAGIEFSLSTFPENHYVPKTSNTRKYYSLKETVELKNGLRRWKNWINLN